MSDNYVAIGEKSVEVIPYNLQHNKFHLHQNVSVKYIYKSLISGIKLLLKMTKSVWSMWDRLPQTKSKSKLEKCNCSSNHTKS